MTRETTMTRPLLKTAAVVGLVVAGSLAVALPASAANGRHGFVRGPHDASSTRTYIGSNGHSVSRDETVTRTGHGDFSTSGSVTGPNGRTVTNSGQTDCGRYACAHTGTIAGPNGGSATASGWWWR
jgi:hypothetical protein